MGTLEFHQLEVSEVSRETDESVSITFDVPEGLADTFRHLPGQHVTVRAIIDGTDVRRSYSICSPAGSGELRIGVKQLRGGTFSTYANTRLRPGDVLDVMAPVGEFTIEPDPSASRHVAAIAAGSGITPVLSLAASVLAGEPQSTFTLLFGNRESRSIMFLDEVEGLKDRYPDRFHLMHILSRETGAVPLFTGRIDAAKLTELLDAVVDVSGVDEWFLCGPFGMVKDAKTVLTARGVDEAVVRDELFFAGPPDEQAFPAEPEDTSGFASVTFTLEGRASTVMVDPSGPAILDHALRVRRELPFSCRGGMCASCKARLVTGEVHMDKNYALVDEDLEGGLILTCQSHPVSDVIEIDYDV